MCLFMLSLLCTDCQTLPRLFLNQIPTLGPRGIANLFVYYIFFDERKHQNLNDMRWTRIRVRLRKAYRRKLDWR